MEEVDIEPKEADIELINLILIQKKTTDKEGNTVVVREQHISTSPHYNKRTFPWQDFVRYFLAQVEAHLDDAKKDAKPFKSTVRVVSSDDSESEEDM